MSDTDSSASTLQSWLQQHAVAIVGAALIGAGGGYIGGSQVDSYRLTALEKEVGDLGDKLDRLADSLADAGSDRWRRSDHERWERGELAPRFVDIEARLRALELHQRSGASP